MTNKTNSYQELISRVNQTPQDGYAIMALSKAIAYSVIRKVADPQNKGQANRPSDSGHNPAIMAIKRDVASDTRTLDNTRYALDGATRMGYDDDGDLVEIVVDDTLDRASKKLMGQVLGDGIDLVQEAACALLSEISAQADREPGQAVDLERPYMLRRLRRRVYIKVDAPTAWEDTETTPIQEAYRAVRRAIQQSRHIQTDPRDGYTYLDDVVVGPYSGMEAVYIRVGKYADLGGRVTDFGGREITPTTADAETVRGIASAVADMALTKRETTLLRYRLSGYGHKAIATAMGISEDNAKRCARRIQEKAVACGLVPPARHDDK